MLCLLNLQTVKPYMLYIIKYRKKAGGWISVVVVHWIYFLDYRFLLWLFVFHVFPGYLRFWIHLCFCISLLNYACCSVAGSCPCCPQSALVLVSMLLTPAPSQQVLRCSHFPLTPAAHRVGLFHMSWSSSCFPLFSSVVNFRHHADFFVLFY